MKNLILILTMVLGTFVFGQTELHLNVPTDENVLETGFKSNSFYYLTESGAFVTNLSTSSTQEVEGTFNGVSADRFFGGDTLIYEGVGSVGPTVSLASTGYITLGESEMTHAYPYRDISTNKFRTEAYVVEMYGTGLSAQSRIYTMTDEGEVALVGSESNVLTPYYDNYYDIEYAELGGREYLFIACAEGDYFKMAYYDLTDADALTAPTFQTLNLASGGLDWSKPVTLESFDGTVYVANDNNVFTITDVSGTNLYTTLSYTVPSGVVINNIEHDIYAGDLLHVSTSNGIYSELVETVSVDEEDDFFKETVNIYPNPNNGNFTVANVEYNNTLNIYSTDGRLIFSETSTGYDMNISLDSYLPNGIYIVQITNDNGVVETSKFVKQ